MKKKPAKISRKNSSRKPATQADLQKLHKLTQHDLELWGGHLSQKIDNLDTKIDTVKIELEGKIDNLDTKIDNVKTELIERIERVDMKIETTKEELTEELKRHFDAGVEIMRSEFTGGYKDEIIGLKDKDKEHDREIATIKHTIGLAA